MRLVIDDSLCMGTGECKALAPDAIEFDEMGIARVADPDHEFDEPTAQKMMRTCPSMAIAERA